MSRLWRRGAPCGSVLELLGVFWPYLLLVHLPRLASLASSVAFAVVKSRLDHAIPDELPRTAGEWLKAQLLEGPEAATRAVVHTARGPGGDAYLPVMRLITLTDETHFKRDPVYWAIAAHELGHARLKERHPIVAALLASARFPKWALATFGIALIAGNVLYGLPGVTELAFDLLLAALALDALTLVDEAAASVTALRLLSRTPELGPRHVRAARLTLLFAFLTY